MSDDVVAHPPHYTAHPSGVECIEITRHMGFNLGNATKYIWRAGLKGDALEDLRKAAWYIADEIARIEADRAQLRTELEQDIATEEPFRLPNVTVDGQQVEGTAKLFRFPPPAERWHE